MRFLKSENSVFPHRACPLEGTWTHLRPQVGSQSVSRTIVTQKWQSLLRLEWGLLAQCMHGRIKSELECYMLGLKPLHLKNIFFLSDNSIAHTTHTRDNYFGFVCWSFYPLPV